MNVQFHQYSPTTKVDSEGCMVCERLDDLTAIVSFEEENEVACGAACFMVTRFHPLCSEHHHSLVQGLMQYS